jgi:hypothetical protein
MTGDEFATELRNWKQELKDDVIFHFRSSNKERGDLAFERWEERFTSFLRKYTPNEAKRFQEKMQHYGYLIIPGEHPYERFMREDGNTCFAFIDDLAESALKGRIKISQKKAVRPKKVHTSSLKVFLSYAREDIASAQRLYDNLRAEGADVWFDKYSLVPGQNWETEIVQAIRGSRFFLALLSAKSVNKKGYVQKEIKQALDVLDEYPETGIFLIPVRLDNCKPTYEKLRHLQWVDMFPDWDDGLAHILKALKSQ